METTEEQQAVVDSMTTGSPPTKRPREDEKEAPEEGELDAEDSKEEQIIEAKQNVGVGKAAIPNGNQPQLSKTIKEPTISSRLPFDSTHRVQRLGGKYHVLLAITGSVAAIKTAELIQELYRQSPPNKLAIKVIATPSALNFFQPDELAETVYDDRDEWNMWKKRGDPVLHIELRKWADSLLIAPLDANTMAKVANGICDNLVASTIRAWDAHKPLYFAPAMNTAMWENALTYQHLKTLKELLQYREIPPIEKELMCGDKGYGAMASLQMIGSIVAADVRNKFAIYSYAAAD